MAQRMCGDIQNIQDESVAEAVGIIRRKAVEQNPRDFESSTAGISQEEINQLVAELQLKQQVPTIGQQQYGGYPYA